VWRIADQTEKCAGVKAAAYVLVTILTVPGAYVTVCNFVIKLILKAT
jgi:hypothetical protein